MSSFRLMALPAEGPYTWFGTHSICAAEMTPYWNTPFHLWHVVFHMTPWHKYGSAHRAETWDASDAANRSKSLSCSAVPCYNTIFFPKMLSKCPIDFMPWWVDKECLLTVWCMSYSCNGRAVSSVVRNHAAARPEARFNIYTISRVWDPHYNDKRLVFVIGIPILVKEHFVLKPHQSYQLRMVTLSCYFPSFPLNS